MLFSEVYGTYYIVISALLQEAGRGGMTWERIQEMISDRAFKESGQFIPDKLSDGSWPLLEEDLTARIPPVKRPLTTLERRWMAAVLQDPRMRLFDPDVRGLDESPLYASEWIQYFDRDQDGDPYEEEAYQKHFCELKRAIHQEKPVRVRFVSGKGEVRTWEVRPESLEYSPRDDCFRLQGTNSAGRAVTIRVSRIQKVEILQGSLHIPERKEESLRIVFTLTDERGALERCMLLFSWLEKETRRMDECHYRVELRCRPEDLSEIRIRILSMGPMVQVLEPGTLAKELQERIKTQREILSCWTFPENG